MWKYFVFSKHHILCLATPKYLAMVLPICSSIFTCLQIFFSFKLDFPIVQVFQKVTMKNPKGNMQSASEKFSTAVTIL